MLFGGHHATPPPTRHTHSQPMCGPGGPPPLIRFRLPSCRFQPQPEVPPPEQPPPQPPMNFNPYIAACIHAPPAWLPPPPHTYTSAPIGKYIIFIQHLSNTHQHT